MKFSNITALLSLFLATTTLAAPTGTTGNENLALEVRAKPSSGKPTTGKPTTDTTTTTTGSSAGKENYDAIKHLTTKVGWHAFQYVWEKVDQKDPAMQELTVGIDGSHVAILVGEIKADKTFTGRYYHIVRKERTPVEIGKMDGQALKVVSSDFTGKRDSTKTPIKAKKLFGTPRKTGAAVGPIAEATLGSKTYSIKTFNCKIFADQVWEAIK